MGNPLQTKIKAFREAKNLTQKDLALMLGIKAQSVQQWESGEGNPSTKRIPELAEALGVSVDVLMSKDLIGIQEGVILTGNVKSLDAMNTKLFTYLPFLSAEAQAELTKMSVENFELKLDETYPVLVPTISITERHIAIKVIGDSMEPGIRNGAIVLAERVDDDDIKYESGGVYAIIYAKRCVVKRIKSNDINQDGTLMLWSDNDRYGHIKIQGNEIAYMWRVLRKIDEEIR